MRQELSEEYIELGKVNDMAVNVYRDGI